MVGRDPFSGAERLTFGLPALGSGLGLVPVLIGLFAVSEILLQAARTWRESNSGKASTMAAADVSLHHPANDHLGWREFRSLWRPVAIGSATGTFIGALPGAGATLAGFLSHGLARRASKHPERFGKGSLEGVAAPEAGNSATASATLIPLFAFGIPGSGSAALIGAAFMMQGISPGPTMIDENMAIVYAIFVLLLIGGIFNLLTSKLLLPYYSRIAMLQPRYILPVVLGLAVLGTYATNNVAFDVWVLLAAGLVGVAMRLLAVPIAPLALGFILGPGLERALRQSLILGHNDLAYLVASPAAIAIYAASTVMLMLLFRAHSTRP
jgi:putative tricarboxylic transport membrane protein